MAKGKLFSGIMGSRVWLSIDRFSGQSEPLCIEEISPSTTHVRTSAYNVHISEPFEQLMTKLGCVAVADDAVSDVDAD